MNRATKNTISHEKVFFLASSATKDTTKVDSVRYQKICQLGRGRFGKVSLMKKIDEENDSERLRPESTELSQTSTKCSFSDDLRANFIALKRISPRHQTKRAFFREVELQTSVSNHPCITKLMTSFVYVTACEFGMGLQYSPNGELSRIVNEGVGLEETLAKSCVVQMCHALNYIHKKHMAHLDIKPDNILIHQSTTFHLKLCDFNSARLLLSSASQIKSGFGHEFTPPEMLRQAVASDRQSAGNSSKVDHSARPHLPRTTTRSQRVKDFLKFHVTTDCDVWSLGVLIIYLLTGKCPWTRATSSDHSYNEAMLWREGSFSIKPRLFENPLTEWTREILIGLLNPQQESRWPISILLSLVDKQWSTRAKTEASSQPLLCDPVDVAMRRRKSEKNASDRCFNCFFLKCSCVCQFL